jgi:hypothetical protein
MRAKEPKTLDLTTETKLTAETQRRRGIFFLCFFLLRLSHAKNVSPERLEPSLKQLTLNL